MSALEQLLQTPSRWPYVDSRWGPVPALPVALTGPQGGGTTIGYLDSGADTTAIPMEFAPVLGVTLEDADGLIAYAGGQAVEYLRSPDRITLEIAGRSVEVEPIFGWFEHLIVGRDVFAHFRRVIFDERAGEVVLEPHAEG